jgi:hypothetical protein
MLIWVGLFCYEVMDRGKSPEQDRQNNHLLKRKNDIEGEIWRAMNAFLGSLAPSRRTKLAIDKSKDFGYSCFEAKIPELRKEGYGHLFCRQRVIS